MKIQRTLLSCCISTTFCSSSYFTRAFQQQQQQTTLQKAFTNRHRSLSFSSLNMAEAADTIVPGRPTWHQTMLRIKDPVRSLHFYTELLGFTLIDTFHFPQYKFSLYFLATLQEPYHLKPGSQEAHEYLWTMKGVTLELTHNHGNELQDDFKYHVGNQEKDGE